MIQAITLRDGKMKIGKCVFAQSFFFFFFLFELLIKITFFIFPRFF